MGAAYLNDVDLVKTIMLLKEFRPAEGTTGRILISSEPGCGARVKYVIAATEEIGLVFEVTEPPSNEALSSLYLESKRVLDAAWDDAAVSSAVPGQADFSLGGIAMNFPGLGYDQ